MIITVGSSKGGSGKSTIASNLAVMAATEGRPVLLVDADLQASAMAFRAMRQPDDIQAIQITTPTLHKDLAQFDHELIIIDAGGRDSKTFRSAIYAADLLIIPCLPSAVDFWAANDAIEILSEARSFRDIPANFVLNQLMPNTRLSTEIVDAMRDFENEVSLLKSALHSRVAYKHAFSEGKGVVELSDKKAANEIKNLYHEILNHKEM